MRFVDIAIDLAAVLRASRGVASKHVALRSRQLDAYSRTSGVGRAVREKAEKVQEEAEEYVAKAKEGLNEQQQQQQQQQHRQDAENVSPAARQRHVGEDGNGIDSSRAQAIFDNTLSSSKPNVPPTERNATAASSSVPHTNVSADDLGAPPDVDINIFHTARGSKILESVRNQRESQANFQQGKATPSKEHPLRHWPPPRPVPEEAEAEVEEDAAPETSTHTEPRIETTKVKTPEPLQRSEKDSIIKTSPVAETTPVDKGTAEAAKILAQTDETPTTPAYVLRESKVPSSRMSRLWNYGGLAAGMLGGAMSESFSRALGSGSQGSVMLSGANMERLVAKLSRMRGAALKLGQMMSFQDSKMLPAPIQEVLQRVQDRADYMPAWQRDRVLVANLGTEWRELFSEFEEKPMAAASIGQVHKAILKSTGKPVAVKIQFPGVADSINSDLDNLSILLTATKLLPKGLYLNKTIDNARLELGWECDYEREAECARRYKKLLASEEDVFMVPDVHLEASGKQVLTMDFMDGVGVTRIKSFTQEQRDWIGTQILRLSLREITEFKFMQTDPNWTNFLYNDALKKLELLDFGASREYPEKFVTQYVQLLEAASRNDRDAVKTLSESLGYLTGHESRIMLDAHIQSVLTLAEPFLESAPEVYDFKDQTITERVKALIPVMLRERLAPPPEETYSLHRKLSGAFLLCARLGSKVRCREMFVKAVDRSGYVVKGQ